MNHSKIFFDENFAEYYPGNRAKSAVLFLHGYPANLGDKNRDLINSKCDYDQYIIHHVGLGNSKGEFSFKKSISACKKIYDLLKEKYQFVTIVGHSWGGFVALNIPADFRVLISPFMITDDDQALKQTIQSVYSTTKNFIPHLTEQEVTDEIFSLPRKFNLKNIRVIQASNDIETPIELSKEKLQGKIDKFIEIKTNHNFDDKRFELKEMIHQMIVEQYYYA